MFEQRGDEGGDNPMVPEPPEDGQPAETLRPTEGYACYSLEVLRLLED